ncbi:MAG: DNA-3-methyladenine glycosylase I [Bacteroidota bacterium]
MSFFTVLKKRAGYRQAFAGFDVSKTAAFGEEKLQELYEGPGIIRNRIRIQDTVNNA